MVSTMQKPEIVRNYLSKESSEGWVLGLLPLDLFSSEQISRIGVFLKGSTGKWFPIVDLSTPEGFSVNDNIDEILCYISYILVEDAVQEIKGQSSQLAKCS